MSDGSQMLQTGLAAATQAVGTYAQVRGGKKAQKRAHKYNLKMAEYQHTKNLEQWNRANQYNDPTEQMARLKAAGLNPNLVYGSGTTQGATSGSLPSFQAPQMDVGSPISPDYSGAIAGTQNMVQQIAQIDNLKAQRENIKQDTINKGIESQIKGLSAERKGLDLNQQRALNPYQLQYAQESVTKQASQISNLAKTGKLINGNTSLTKAKHVMQGIENSLAKDGVFRGDPAWQRQTQMHIRNASKAVRDWWFNLPANKIKP